jgi:hypothetical protein
MWESVTVVTVFLANPDQARAQYNVTVCCSESAAPPSDYGYERTDIQQVLQTYNGNNVTPKQIFDDVMNGFSGITSMQFIDALGRGFRYFSNQQAPTDW